MYALNQCPIYGTLSLIARIHGSRSQRVEVEVAPLTITLSDPPAKFLLPVPMTLCSADLEVLIPVEETLPPGETTILLSWKLRLPPGHFGLLLPLSQQAKKGVTVLAEVTDYQGEISLLLHNQDKEEYA
uniref:dUTPase-like domain-containing protein n=2 Tax=Macaca TaxID=9539 RepID=A0A5F8ALQ0_MACMU